MGLLDGRVALVTGGSKGLGAATARLFAQEGARVVVTFGHDAEAAARLLASLPGGGHRASQTRSEDTPAIEDLAAAIADREGRLDILVNNAGSTRVIAHADLRALDDEFFDFVMAVNLRGPFAMVRAFAPLLA
jgi:3-oxoacyl-[acyl-carrier protein] reductase